VVGVFSDYGNPNGQVIIGIDALVAHYPQVAKLRYGVRVPPERSTELKRQLIENLGLPETAVVNQASLKRQSRAIFDQTFKVTAGRSSASTGDVSSVRTASAALDLRIIDCTPQFREET